MPLTPYLCNIETYSTDADKDIGRSLRRSLPGSEGEHDGQVMIHLESKHFVVLDYSYAPNTEDQEYAKAHSPHRAGLAFSILCQERLCQDWCSGLFV